MKKLVQFVFHPRHRHWEDSRNDQKCLFYSSSISALICERCIFEIDSRKIILYHFILLCENCNYLLSISKSFHNAEWQQEKREQNNTSVNKESIIISKLLSSRRAPSCLALIV
ncbi:conserved hypothetical protein [Trichinella spiralis]|uniref:hypothetical protein n=1 Tax=Trichinella spiralis TaxID=6334 RepID=UPI0001EFDD61|nr:conserved hypothetical protein [Trichinella spiralis]